MSVGNFEELRNHIGHNVVCVGYNKEMTKGKKEVVNVAIECEDCSEALFDFDKQERGKIMEEKEFYNAIKECVNEYGVFVTVLLNIGVAGVVFGTGILLVYLITSLIK